MHVTSGPALERAGDLAVDPQPAGRGRRALHRRDPPPRPPGRRGAVPGDGGLPARHRARQGPGRPVDPPRRPPLHPRRRHHPHRAHHRAAPRPLRPRGPPRLLRAGRPGVDRRCGPPASSTSRSTRRAPPRSPVGRGARPASPTASCAESATSPRCGATGVVDDAAAHAGLAVFGVDERGLDKVDRAVLGALCERFGGGPVGLSTLAISVSRAHRDRRGRVRAVPHPRGAAHAHAPRPGRHAGRLGAPRAGPARLADTRSPGLFG